MPLSPMELQALLNRRQQRKRPAANQIVNLDSEPEDEQTPKLPQPQICGRYQSTPTSSYKDLWVTKAAVPIAQNHSRAIAWAPKISNQYWVLFPTFSLGGGLLCCWNARPYSLERSLSSRNWVHWLQSKPNQNRLTCVSILKPEVLRASSASTCLVGSCVCAMLGTWLRLLLAACGVSPVASATPSLFPVRKTCFTFFYGDQAW